MITIFFIHPITCHVFFFKSFPFPKQTSQNQPRKGLFFNAVVNTCAYHINIPGIAWDTNPWKSCVGKAILLKNLHQRVGPSAVATACKWGSGGKELSEPRTSLKGKLVQLVLAKGCIWAKNMVVMYKCKSVYKNYINTNCHDEVGSCCTLNWVIGLLYIITSYKKL